MSLHNSHELVHHLRELNAILERLTYQDLKVIPEAGIEVTRLVELLSDRGLLQQFGHFTLNEACEKIRDILEKSDQPQVKSFSHCGESHFYHSLQT